MKRAVVLFAFTFACGGADLGLLAPNDASTQNDDAQTADATAGDSSATDASPDDAITLDVIAVKDAPTYQDPGIGCGKIDCDESTNLCCGTATSYYPTTTYSYACEPLTDYVQCAAGLPIYCDDDKDCPNAELCCGDDGYNGFSKVSCKQTCTGNVYGSQQIHFCDPKASDCTGNTTCKPLTTLDGYFACQ